MRTERMEVHSGNMDLTPIDAWLKQFNHVLSSYTKGSWKPASDNQATLILTAFGQSITYKIAEDDAPSDEPSTDLNAEWTEIATRADCFRQFHSLCLESEIVSTLTILESLSTSDPINVCTKRVKDHFITLLAFLKDVGILLQSEKSEVAYSKMVVIDEGESLTHTICKTVIPWLSRGGSVSLQLRDTYQSKPTTLLVAYFVHLCHTAKFPAGVVNLMLSRNEPIQITKFLDPVVVIILESGDIHSSAEDVLQLLVDINPQSPLLVFVQQNVSTKFVNRLNFHKEKVLNATINTSKALKSYEINVDAIDPSAIKFSKTRQLNVYQFRTVEEATKLVNYYSSIERAIIWSENVSLALEMSGKLSNCSVVSLNTGLTTPRSFSRLCFAQLDNINLKLCTSIVEVSAVKQINDVVTKALQGAKSSSAFHVDTRFHKLASVVLELSRNRSELLDIIKTAHSEGNSLVSTPDEVVLKKRVPVGVVAVETFDEEELSDCISVVSISLLLGNAVIIFTSEVAKEPKLLKALRLSMPENCIQLLDKRLLEHLSPNTEFSILKLNNLIVGSFLRFRLPLRTSDVLSFTTRCQSIWIPATGFISYAK